MREAVDELVGDRLCVPMRVHRGNPPRKFLPV